MRIWTRTSPTGSRGPSKGLTLIELVVVLVIIGSLGLLALPRLSAWNQDGYLKAAARKVTAAARLARSEAITRSEEVELKLDLGENRLSLAAGDETLWTDVLKNGVKVGEVVVRGKGTVTEPVLIFRSDGRAPEAAIYLGEEERGLTLHLEPLTGQVEILAGWRRYDWPR